MQRTIYFFFFLFFFNSLTLFSQPAIVWQKCLGGTENDWGSIVRQTSELGYIIAGATDSYDGDVSGCHGYVDGWVVKLDDNKNILWQHSFGGTIYEALTDIEPTPDGGYIACGYTD